ncbi:unnamed protein product [Cladocopium goreaui]|uniref:Uncharacterized protein n=1 Tax=Cladocopium goreaui TaxID=2562237 RepID=A0A9P1CZY0_9DINO|nr:unnamed protein product [Cladocopium goreaui]
MVEQRAMAPSRRKRRDRTSPSKIRPATVAVRRCAAELLVAAVDASTRCVFLRHAEKLGCKVVSEVERLEDLTKELLSAQNHNCSSPLLVFVGERRWESRIAKLHLHVRPPFVVRTSVDFEHGPCHRHMLPSGSFNAFASIVQDCETWWEEACNTGTWYMAAPLRPVLPPSPNWFLRPCSDLSSSAGA